VKEMMVLWIREIYDFLIFLEGEASFSSSVRVFSDCERVVPREGVEGRTGVDIRGYCCFCFVGGWIYFFKVVEIYRVGI